jgi:predicted transcriptional regulator of viral defense system
VRIDRVTDLASRQHGAVSVRQLRRLGVSARAQSALTANGRLQLVAPGVAVVAGSPDTWHRRLRIGLLAQDARAWVSHESAAALHNLDRTVPGRVELTVPRGARLVQVPGARVHTTTDLGRLDVLTISGFRCASATRTILDLAATGASSDRLAAAIDSAIRNRLSAPVVLAERLASFRGPGHHGVRLLDKLLIDAGGETMLERLFLRLVRRAGLPRPRTQRRIRGDRDHVARVDFLFVPEQLVVEVTGRLGHSTPSDRGRDAQRRNDLQDLGYAVYEYTWADVTRRPGYVAETMTTRLAARLPRQPGAQPGGASSNASKRNGGATVQPTRA